MTQSKHVMGCLYHYTSIPAELTHDSSSVMSTIGVDSEHSMEVSESRETSIRTEVATKYNELIKHWLGTSVLYQPS